MSFVKELKRRNIFRVGAAYLVIAWLIAQVSQLALDSFGAPDWIIKSELFLLAVGFPVAVLLAWAFELTPDGIKRDRDVDRGDTRGAVRGRKLDFVIIGALVIALGYFVWERQQLVSPVALIDRSIAVLPFVVRSADVEQELFADGLTEEILNSLARTPDLRVTSSTSSFVFKDSGDDIKTIAESLGVSHILEGSVRRSADTLRITARLIRASDGFELWSQPYNRQFADVIAIQEDIAIQIANALETAMDPEALAAMVSAGTHSVPAYEAYLKGIAIRTRSRMSGDTSQVMEIETEFGRAVTFDPQFANAHYQRARFWRMQMTSGGPLAVVKDLSAEEMEQRYFEALNQAIEHEKDIAVKTLYSVLRSQDERDYREALRQIEEYLRLRPADDDALGTRSELTGTLGMYDEGVKLAVEYAQGDTKGSATSREAIWRLFYSGSPDLIVENVNKILAKDPDDMNAVYQSHKAYLWAMDIDSARIALQKILASPWAESSKSLAQLRQACAENRKNDAQRFLAEVLEKTDRLQVIWGAYMAIGDDDRASKLLQEYDEQRRFHELSALLFYGELDFTNLPNLSAQLSGQGIVDRQVFDIPFRCDR